MPDYIQFEFIIYVKCFRYGQDVIILPFLNSIDYMDIRKLFFLFYFADFLKMVKEGEMNKKTIEWNQSEVIARDFFIHYRAWNRWQTIKRFFFYSEIVRTFGEILVKKTPRGHESAPSKNIGEL